MEYSLVGESLKFMLLGMLIVFVFLYVLVEVMKLQARIISKYFPEKEIPVSTSGSSTTDTDEEARRTAAIIAAVTEFRKKK